MIGKTIKRMRENQGLTLAQAAKKAKLTSSAICQMENGKRNPSLETLKKLAKAYHSRDWIILRVSNR